MMSAKWLRKGKQEGMKGHAEKEFGYTGLYDRLCVQ